MIKKERTPDGIIDLRKRAEQKAGTTGHMAAEVLTPEQLKQALHELQVHQIELEMQNEELRHTQEALEASHARYFDLYDLAPVGYCTISENNLIIEANLTLADLLGETRSALINVSLTQYIFPVDQDIFYTLSRQHVDNGVVQTCELRMITKNGNPPFWAKMMVSVYREQTGSLVYHIVISDITERVLLKDALQKNQNNLEITVIERTAELLVANEMKLLGQLTAGVAHEVRNPLNGILAIMGALSKELSSDDRFEPYMKHMRNQVTRLSVLMDDLLILGRPLHEENLSEISLVLLIEKNLASCLQTIPSSQPSVRLIKPEFKEPCMVKVDTTSMSQLIINLIENAINHSPTGTEITCSVDRQKKDMVIFSVKDRGTGIPEEILPKIFEPFFTTRKGGTGLGLSIVRRIVENHQGTIKAYNNADGPGATFEVVFPLAKK